MNEVTNQDRSTFLNYLFPDHVSRVNDSVFNRKLQTEVIDEKMHRPTLGTGDRSSTDMSHVEAQLEPIRTTSQAVQR
jgi:hypothetical protein